MRTDPFRELDRLTQQVFGTTNGGRPAAMPIDAYRAGDHFYVHFDLPGVDPDQVDLTVERNVLTVRAERRGPTDRSKDDDGVELVVSERPRGSFSRELFLGDTLDTDHLQASYDAGVLTVRIPIADQAKPRRIEIGAPGSSDRQQLSAQA